jgi:hypothetical protein
MFVRHPPFTTPNYLFYVGIGLGRSDSRKKTFNLLL